MLGEREAACGSPPAGHGLRPAPFAPAAPFFFDCARAWKPCSSSRRADPLRLGLEVQPERALDGDLAEAEVRGREDPADDDLLVLAVLGDGARVAVLEVGEDLQDIPRAVERDLAPLVAQALAHRRPERRGVDELNLAAARRRLAVGHNPHVGGDAGVVEELLGERDERFEQIVFQNEAADLALAAPRVAREERRAVHDDRDARAAFLRVLRVREHVQQEEELAVADARQTRTEAAGRAALVLGPHGVFVALPVLAVGRIRDQVVEMLVCVAVVRERCFRRRCCPRRGRSGPS